MDGEVGELQSLAADVQAQPPVLPLESEPGTDGGGSEHPDMVASSAQELETPLVMHSVVTRVWGKDFEGTPQGRATLDSLAEVKPASVSQNHPLYCLY